MLGNSVSGEKAVGDVVISVSHVSKTYKLYRSHQDRLKEALHPFRKCYHEEFHALHDVSFEIRKGECVGIVGRNGAGKSTLLQLIVGVLSPTSGSIRVAGTISAILELGAGFNPDLTSRENVVLANTIQGAEEKEIAKRVSLVESFADIGLFFDQPMKVYSSGMYARVAFAHAINVAPDVLIVDEILGVGDAKFQEKCYSRIRAMREAGVCILFVSHSTEIVQRNCDKALLVEGGKLITHDRTNAVITAYHDLLYGSGHVRESEIAPTASDQNRVETISKSDQVISTELHEFINGSERSLYKARNYYNKNELRLGNGGAEIVDFIITVHGRLHFNAISGNEALAIYLKVLFKREIHQPQIGWAIVTSEGIKIAGANTTMCNISIPKAHSGTTFVYEIKILPNLSGGNYFLNLGIGEILNNVCYFLDVRRSVIHLAVSDDNKATGFFRIPFECKVVRSVNYE